MRMEIPCRFPCYREITFRETGAMETASCTNYLFEFTALYRGACPREYTMFAWGSTTIAWCRGEYWSRRTATVVPPAKFCEQSDVGGVEDIMGEQDYVGAEVVVIDLCCATKSWTKRSLSLATRLTTNG